MPVIYTKGALKKIKKDELIDMFYFQQDNIKKLQGESRSELGTPYKELYEAQYEETNKEHQRYLETAERYSDRLWEVCQELDIENDDTSENIIEAINKLKEENKKLKEENEKLKWDCEQMGKSPWVGTPACDKMLKLKEENKEAEDNLDEEMLKNEKLEVEVKKLKSTIIVKKALINHWKNKYDKSLEA